MLTTPPSWHSTLRLFLAVFASGCSAPTEGLIWSGWNYGWESLSHRVAYVSAIVEEDATLQMGLVGGDWSTGSAFSDIPQYRMSYQLTSTNAAALIHGATALTIGPEEDASSTVEVDEATLVGWSNYAVVLRGLQINTDVPQTDAYPDDYDPALGYTSRGFGVWVGEANSIDEGRVSFDVGGSLRWGPQDREDMNSAIPLAQSELTIAWTVVGFKGDQDTAEVTASISHPHGIWSEQTTLGEGDLDLDLHSDHTHGIGGLVAFDLLATEQDGSDNGDYLRSFGMELEGDSDGPGFDGYILADLRNASAIELAAIDVTATATATWIGFDDRKASVEKIVRSGAHEVGTAEIVPTEDTP